MTELEKKLLLSKEEYELIINHSNRHNKETLKSATKQINYYYDTDELSMNRQNTTCRVRLKDGKYKGTIKYHLPQSEHSTETNVDVYDGIRKNAFTEMGLKLKGGLITERYIILKDSTCEVVLDKNTYLDHEDYELEIEYEPMFEHHAAQIFETIVNICRVNPKARQVRSKSERFFERYSSKERR